VQCQLCPRNCVIGEGKVGFCNVRKNKEGKLYSLVYGKFCSIALDPIEKKPLYHFHPGSQVLSLATVGCNLRCSFCQNWEISTAKEIRGQDLTPEQVVSIAKDYSALGIAYTYTEPLIAIETYLEIMKIARKQGLFNVWVSNGYTNPEPAKKAAKYLDAINVDLKGSKKMYNELCAVPDDKPIYEALKIYKQNKVHIETTTLIVPGYNDDEKTLQGIVDWVKQNLGTETPMHFSRFHPDHKLTNVPQTPIETIKKALEIAKKAGIKHVHAGNVPNLL
ncbi:MAG: AmmeMemoRadiSam system radical SAM enzyme, partial [Nanoarchaeota archaeon]|nr:AmmeMemoRadiSam system radical SAM enzyme [Nanoarchaeota archaeon]